MKSILNALFVRKTKKSYTVTNTIGLHEGLF